MTIKKFFFLYSMLLISVLVGTSLCYRYLITIPEVTRSVLAYQQREIGAVYQSLNERFGLFQTMNYDYAVWNDSYQFFQDGNEEFVKNNYVSDMFVSLKNRWDLLCKPSRGSYLE